MSLKRNFKQAEGEERGESRGVLTTCLLGCDTQGRRERLLKSINQMVKRARVRTLAL